MVHEGVCARNQKILKMSFLDNDIRCIFAPQNSYSNNLIIIDKDMTKADLVNDIAEQTGIEKADVQTTIEAFMQNVKGSLESGNNVYLRGFGSFVIKERAKKTGRNILKNTTIEIPAHNIPSFKPAKTFVEGVKTKVKVNGK